MFIPFLTAAAVATAFAKLGAMSVQIAVLTALLKAVSVAFLAATIAAIFRNLISSCSGINSRRPTPSKLPSQRNSAG